MNAYKFVGTIYVAPVDAAGAETGTWRRGGNMYPFNLKVETDTKTQKSAEHDRAGQTLASATQITDILAEATLRQLDSRSFAWVVSGEAAEMTGDGGNVPQADTTALAPGDYTNLPHEDISNFVFTNQAGDTTYQVGVDYILDAELGMWTPTATGGISKDDICKASYDYAAQSGYQVKIGTQPIIRVAMKGNLLNTYTNKKSKVFLRSVVITAPEGINLISDLDAEYEEVPVEMKLETPTGQTNPGTIDGVPL